MNVLWWLLTLPLRLLWGAATFCVVLFVGIVSQAGRDDAEADWGRWRLQGENHPDAWLIPPAIGRRGWRRR